MMRTSLSSKPRDHGATALVLLASVAVAFAVWLVPASLHVVGLDAGVLSRVALLAHPAVLAGLLTLALALGLGASRFAGGRLDVLARVVAPLSLLFLWVLPYLPWVPEQIPLLLVLAGPARWIVLGIALLGCGVAAATTVSIDAWNRLPIPGPRGIFLTTFVLFVALGGYVKYHQGLGGDEPHYLVITHSLLADGDIRIENNHDAGDYVPFWSGPLRPHFLRRGLDSVMYSVHAPGLPALMVPAYALAGQWGAMAFIVLLASLAGTAVFGLAERLTNRRVALVTWAAVVLTIPFAPQSWLIFPEMPAALVMAWAAAWLFAPLPARTGAWVWRGAVIGLLPWLHMKYSFLLAGVTVCLLTRLWPRRASAAALLAPMAVSGLVWFGSFYVMYGTLNPTVVYGYGSGAGLDPSNIPRGVLGLLFDQEFGLLLYSPIYVVAAFGAWLLVRREDTRWPTVGLVATSLGFVLTVVPYYMWWGGWSVPARFLLPILPVAGPMLAVGLDRCRGAASRGVAGVLLLASVASFVVVTYDPGQRLLFNDRDGTGRLVEAIQGGMDLTVVLPSFIQPDWGSQLPYVLSWVVAGLLAGLVAFAAGSRHATVRRDFWAGAVCVVGFGMAGSLVSGASLSGARDAGLQARGIVERGRQAALAAFDGERLRAYSYRDRAMLSEAELFDMTTIVTLVGHTLPGSSYRPRVEWGQVAGPYALPAGRYIVRVWVDGALPTEDRNGQVWVAYHRGPGVLGQASVAGANPAEIVLDLPVTFDPVWVGATTEAVANGVTQVEIEPVSVAPRTGRPTIPNIRHAELIDQASGRYAIHIDDNVWVEREGYWVRGGRESSVYVTPGGASALRLSIRNGAMPGPVSIDVDGATEVIQMEGRQTHEILLPLTGQEATVPIAISPTNGFRPAEHNPESRDNRWLGAWVSLALE